MKTIKEISVIGLGKLGLCLAACLASKGYRVLGVDKDAQRVKMVNLRKAPFYEPMLGKLLDEYGNSLTATEDYGKAIGETDATFIVVNTPSKPDGSFSVRYLKDASEKIGKALREKERYQLVLVTSTVLPGTTRNVVKPALEESSGRECGEEFGLCYNPEFIALGDVVQGLTRPDFVLVGEFDRRSGDLTERIYSKLCDHNPPIARMSLENAELTKIALNSYITMKISFANTLAELCEHIPNGNVDTVTEALGYDRRIGSLYLKGGLGFGGPCFPRDNKAFSFAAKQMGSTALLATGVDEVNEHQTRRLLRLISSRVRKGGAVSVLGATYKPNTEVVEASPALDLARGLCKEGFSISLYDPVGNKNARKSLGEGYHYASSLEECLKGADACVLATPWEEFRHLTTEKVRGLMRGSVILDCWRILNPERAEAEANLLRIGVAQPSR